MERCLAARDALAYSLLWSTRLRGINAREACLEHFWLPATDQHVCQPAGPSIYTSFSLAVGSAVDIIPQRLSLKAN